MEEKELDNLDSPGQQLPPFVIAGLSDSGAEGGRLAARRLKSIALTPALRTSGLLHALPAEDLKNLLFLLTFLTPDGQCLATLNQLAHAMQVSEAKARARLQRLMNFQWRDKPMVIKTGHSTENEMYAPAPEVLNTPAGTTALIGPITRREAVIETSRQKYGRPRAEVEAMIYKEMGWGRLEERSEKWHEEVSADNKVISQTRQKLLQVGVTAERANSLLEQFDLRRIQQQLDWLPYRQARNPAAFLVAAIEGDYEKPLVMENQETGKP